jgi:hypothetical protein
MNLDDGHVVDGYSAPVRGADASRTDGLGPSRISPRANVPMKCQRSTRKVLRFAAQDTNWPGRLLQSRHPLKNRRNSQHRIACLFFDVSRCGVSLLLSWSNVDETLDAKNLSPNARVSEPRSHSEAMMIPIASTGAPWRCGRWPSSSSLPQST